MSHEVVLAMRMKREATSVWQKSTPLFYGVSVCLNIQHDSLTEERISAIFIRSLGAFVLELHLSNAYIVNNVYLTFIVPWATTAIKHNANSLSTLLRISRR